MSCWTVASAVNVSLQACIAGWRRVCVSVVCVCVCGLSYRWASGSSLASLPSASLGKEQSNRKEE